MHNGNFHHSNQHSGLLNGGVTHQQGHPMSNGGDGTDKWYLKDSMQPIDAAQHGGNCKCYRCQRKLTAI